MTVALEHNQQITIPQHAFAAKPGLESQSTLANCLLLPGHPQAPAQLRFASAEGEKANAASDDLKLPETAPACRVRFVKAPEPSAVRVNELH